MLSLIYRSLKTENQIGNVILTWSQSANVIDLEGVGETERDREREAERDVERDSDPECEREERDESEEEDEDLLRELREETEWRLGDVVLCQGSIHSSLGRRELEIPIAFGLDLSFSSTTASLKSSFLSTSFAVVTSALTFTS